LYFPTTAHGQVKLGVSTRIVVSRSRWWSQTSSLAMISEVHGYSCFIVVVEETASRPCRLTSLSSFYKMMSIDRANAHIASPSVTMCLLWESPSSTLRPHYMVKIAIPRLAKTSFMTNCIFLSISDQESSALPCRPASPCNCWAIIAKTYQVDSCWTDL
jgi:hypothetical protein